MATTRTLVTSALVLLAVNLQLAWFSDLTIGGVVPDLALLVVVGVGLARGPDPGAVCGFISGLALDLAPPADHTVGRWALALVVVGYLAGQVGSGGERGVVASVLAVAGTSFVGTSIFALSGLAVGDPGVTVSQVLRVLPYSLLYDVALAPVVVPLVVGVLVRLDPAPKRWVGV